MRHRFLRDNDGHWFLIPARLSVDKFWSWVGAMEGLGKWDGEDLEKYRIDGGPGHYTVENVQEDA